MKLLLRLSLVVAMLSLTFVAQAGEEIVFTPIEHGTFVIQYGDVTIVIDPVGTAESFKEFPPPTIILITDIHGDHLNPDVVDLVRGKDTAVIGPEAVTDQLENAKTLANGETVKVGDTAIEAIPMYNLTKDRLKYHEKGRGNGYVITLGGKRVYVSGDTEDISEMRSLEDIDFAFVCMNLPYTMTVEQAASAVLEMKPVVVYPYHYRGKGMKSDTGEFKKLVSEDEDIEVRLLEWYP